MKKTRLTTYKSFRVKPDLRLKIALACDSLDITESDFIRESIQNQLMRLQSNPHLRTTHEQTASA